MTITVERVREKYPKEYGDLSDEEIQRILDYMYLVCNFSIKWHRDHPGEKLSDHINKEVPKPESKINAERHKTNKMPPKATLDQKIKWHIDHVAHCKCRPMPDKIKQEIKKRLG